MTETKTRQRDKRQKAAEKIREAERVRDELTSALRDAGIVLPSVNVDAMSYGDEEPRLHARLSHFSRGRQRC